MFKRHKKTIITEMIRNGTCSIEDEDVLTHGLSTAFTLVVSVITMLIISFFFEMMIEGIVFFMTFLAIRTFAGGYHCQNKFQCYVLSTILFVFALFTMKRIPVFLIVQLNLCLLTIALPLILRFSPLETPNRPLDEVERKYFRKKSLLHLLVESVIIILLMITGQKVLALTMCLAAFLCSMVLVAELVRRKFARGGSHSDGF